MNIKNYDKPYYITSGGVVYRKQGECYEYLLLGREEQGTKTYHLPKGTIEAGETLEVCAKREIAEEAGVEVNIISYIGGKHAKFAYNGRYFDKMCHYYVAEYIGELGVIDNEHDFRQWVSYKDAIKKLKNNVKDEHVFVERCQDYINRM